MNETKNKIGIIMLGIIILFFVVGGFFFMKYMVNKDDGDTDKEMIKEVKEVRIDNSKDYIYFNEMTEIIEDVLKQDVVINIKGFENINNTLHNEVMQLSEKQTKVTPEQNIPADTCENDLYEFKYRDYINTEFLDYVSVVLIDFDYNCLSGSNANNIKSYVINKKTGKAVSNEDLLKEFKVTEETINTKVKERLDFLQTLDEEQKQMIDVEGTLNNLKNGSYGVNKALSISKNGKLAINFIVKSSKINYNDSIELN